MMQQDTKDAALDLWLGKAVPRYTSYPAAPHFHDGITAQSYQEWLQAVPEDAGLSLYLHIPFCEKLCWFCGCTTFITSHYKPIQQYLANLKEEIRLVSHYLSGRPLVKHIHFGGGSPSILQEADFGELMGALRDHFTIAADAEIAIEIDPRTLTKTKAELYGKCGINRASLGVQDFHPAVQEAIHRVQSFGLVKQACIWLQDAGIGLLNMDLIYGLPHQTVVTFSETVEKTLELEPARLALFSYAHVPWVKKHQSVIDTQTLPNDHEKLTIYTEASRIIEKAGFTPIGIDHFARDGDDLVEALRQNRLKRNFQGYTTDKGNILIGLGLSSIGAFPQGYVQNQVSASRYQEAIQQGTLPVFKGIASGSEDRLRKQVIDTLMCYLEADPNQIAALNGKPADYFAREMELLEPFRDAGIITINEGQVALATGHRMAVRAICAIFDQYIAKGEGRYSKVA
jgi:oxygen-independent coproporphyrinogen-3 oxidase